MKQATAVDTRLDVYEPLLEALRASFTVTAGAGPLFTTDVSGLFPAFLAVLPESERQHHTCHACQHFVERYGGLVVIRDDGRTVPVMWGDAPDFYGPAFAAVRRLVARARVTGVHVTSERVWGMPVTGPWRHMAVEPSPELVWRTDPGRWLVAHQVAAAKKEDYGTLQRGLAEFSPGVVDQAATMLDAGMLYRSEACLAVARWLKDLYDRRAAVPPGRARDHVTWRAVATAPAGFCHPRTTMIGALLEDIAADKPFDDVRRAFNAKMDPLQYQRPQAAPTTGNIVRAEKLIKDLGLAPALRRRYARLEELQTVWTPPAIAATPPTGSVFGHLRAKDETPEMSMTLPPVTMTWDKFQRTALPGARRIEFCVPAMPASYLAFVTAVDPAAPPILQWDREERRNPVSWYVYARGSMPGQWNLSAGQWVVVNAVALLPFLWDPERSYPQHGAGVVFVLEGAVDHNEAEAGLFPSILKGELREVRATIEAYSKGAKLEGRAEATACGIDLRQGQAWKCDVRVTTASGPAIVYRLDRWD